MKPTPITRSMPSAASSRSPIPVRSFAGLDEPHLNAQRVLGALGAEVGAVVERLVAAAAEIEDDPYIYGIGGRRSGGTGRMDEEEGDVDDEEGRHEEEQLRMIRERWRGGNGGEGFDAG
jgi:hypothetical protein